MWMTRIKRMLWILFVTGFYIMELAVSKCDDNIIINIVDEDHNTNFIPSENFSFLNHIPDAPPPPPDLEPPQERRRCDFQQDASDLHLTTAELIRKNGFPVEIHHVVTEDGFILELHRIPAPGKPILMAFHGMLMTSREWLLNCDGRALPYKLANAGYDVWLCNARGNAYSQKHLNLTTQDAKYWRYAVDDLIKYDAPAGIDYALSVTGQTKLNWYGWSMGSAVILGLLSSRPEYNEKINLIISVGTVAYVGNTKSPLFRLMGLINKVYDRFFTFVTKGAFLPKALFPVLQTLLPNICIPEARQNAMGICSSALFWADGFSPNQVNSAFYPMALGNFPSSSSVKMLNQWFQWINTGVFTQYDYGRRVNMKKYGRTKPPLYDLTKVTAPFVNFWSQNDWISTPQDVQTTMRLLPNVVKNIEISDPQWNHFDFGIAQDIDLHVYNPVIDILNNYTSNQ